MASIEFVAHMSIAVLWAAIFVLHTRRLVRLTRVIAFDAPRDHVLRHRLRRVWWWLGREEFWSAVGRDALYCVQITLMLVVMIWSLW
jgi:hypothetical protein